MKILKVSVPVIITLLSVVFLQCKKKPFQPNGETYEIRYSLQNGEPLYIKNQTIPEDLDISRWVKKASLTAGQEYAYCTSTVVFENCTFEGKVAGYFSGSKSRVQTAFLHPVRFVHCDFKGEVDFRACEFRSSVSFYRCTFFREVTFQGASFGGKVAMRENQFFENTKFQDVLFHEPVNFSESVFHTDVSFQNTYFNDRVLMNMIKVLGYGDFTLMDCDRDFLFNYAECPGRLVFDHSFFRKRSEFLSLQGKDVSMRSCDFYKLKMDKSVLKGRLNLESSRFEMEDFRLENVDVDEIIGING